MILQPVAEKILNCAKETVLAPRTCPQRTSSIARASHVRWSVHGQPADGSSISYDGRSFRVEGAAIMTVRFRESSDEKYEVHVIPYQAAVYQDKGQLRLGSLTETGDISEKVNKRKPVAAWADVQTQVRAAFDRCISSDHSPMPPGCPNDPNVTSTDESIWTLESDPLLNAVAEFDDDTGITHVRGSYSAHLDGIGFFGRVEETQSGDYDARVVIGDTGAEVLDIRHT
ncbi:hypothetical protein [Microbispora sp. GKU 823]|uniref:hypothetical protein n=1 Tax=Microbispora sp. GKU 823 TaxID=1652100 RepID=UPI0011809459|nr:hypothetical protein [Microbispora sp. GKU 823]